MLRGERERERERERKGAVVILGDEDSNNSSSWNSDNNGNVYNVYIKRGGIIKNDVAFEVPKYEYYTAHMTTNPYFSAHDLTCYTIPDISFQGQRLGIRTQVSSKLNPLASYVNLVNNDK